MSNFKKITELIKREVQKLNPDISTKLPIIFLREGLDTEFPKDRDYAYSSYDNEQYVIVFSKKMYHANLSRIRAIMRHELAHIVFMTNDQDHSEQETDDLAEELWGDRLYYDDEDVQTLRQEHYPRPSHLHR